MAISLVLFYNLSGVVMCVLSFLMLAIRRRSGEDSVRFNTAKRSLSVMFLLSGLSMFAAQFDKGLFSGSFEKLNVLMLFFFFLIAQGFLLSFLILYASRFSYKQAFYRVLLPVLILFGVYTIFYVFIGDEPVYSMEKFLIRMAEEPLLWLRCIILIAVVASTFYGILLCYRARKEYHNLIGSYFSETDFSRSIWLSNLLASAEALAIWVLMTYFYTTPILEFIVGVLMMAVFAFYVKEFYEYGKRYESFRPALLLSSPEPILVNDLPMDSIVASKPDEEDVRCAVLLANWEAQSNKPYTKQGLTISDVSKELNIPKYRISNYVNRDRGNFCSWINDLRIKEGARLLKEETHLSISEIAERTGFCDLPAFSRAFKKVNAMSPSEYRNKMV